MLSSSTEMLASEAKGPCLGFGLGFRVHGLGFRV